MRRFQAVVPHGARGRQSDVNDRSRTFEFVMAVVVEQIGHADRCACARGFDDGERGVIIDDVVGEQNFLRGRDAACSASKNSRACEMRRHQQRADRWSYPRIDAHWFAVADRITIGGDGLYSDRARGADSDWVVLPATETA